jgi:hypothetical protein
MEKQEAVGGDWTDASLIEDLRRLKSDSLANEDSDNLNNLSTRVVLSRSSFDHHIDLSELSGDEKNEDGDVVSGRE